jgi:hypothetical protein
VLALKQLFSESEMQTTISDFQSLGAGKPFVCLLLDDGTINNALNLLNRM